MRHTLVLQNVLYVEGKVILKVVSGIICKCLNVEETMIEHATHISVRECLLEVGINGRY